MAIGSEGGGEHGDKRIMAQFILITLWKGGSKG